MGQDKKKILVIDDDKIITELISFVLKKADYEVTVASDGLEGLKKFKEQKFDLIVSDIDMPKMDGITFIEKIQAFQIPVIMLTGNATMERVKKTIKYGAVDFMVKSSFQADPFLQRVQKHLEKHASKSSKGSSSSTEELLEIEGKYIDKTIPFLSKCFLALEEGDPVKKLAEIAHSMPEVERQLFKLSTLRLFQPEITNPTLERICKYMGARAFSFLVASLGMHQICAEFVPKNLLDKIQKRTMISAIAAYKTASETRIKEKELCFALATALDLLPLFSFSAFSTETHKLISKIQLGKTSPLMALKDPEHKKLIRSCLDLLQKHELPDELYQFFEFLSGNENIILSPSAKVAILAHYMGSYLELCQGDFDFLDLFPQKWFDELGIHLPSTLHNCIGDLKKVSHALLKAFELNLQDNQDIVEVVTKETGDKTGPILALIGAENFLLHPLEIRYRNEVTIQRRTLSNVTQSNFECIFFVIDSTQHNLIQKAKELQAFYKEQISAIPVITLRDSHSAAAESILKCLPSKDFLIPVQQKKLDSLLMQYKVLPFKFEESAL